MKHAVAAIALAASSAMGETRVDIEARRQSTDAQRIQLDAEHDRKARERKESLAAAATAQAELDDSNEALQAAEVEEAARQEEARRETIRADDERNRVMRARAAVAEKEKALSEQAEANRALEATAASTIAELTTAQAQLASRRKLVSQHGKLISTAVDAARSFRAAIGMVRPALERDRRRAIALREDVTKLLTKALTTEPGPALLRGLRHEAVRLAALDERDVCVEPESEAFRGKARSAISLVESHVSIIDTLLEGPGRESSDAIALRVRQDRDEIASIAGRWRSIVDRLPAFGKPTLCGTLSQLGKVIDLTEVIAESRRAAAGIDELRAEALQLLRVTDSAVDGARLVEQLRRSLAGLPIRMATLLADGKIGEASLIAGTVGAYAAVATTSAELSPALTESQKQLVAQVAAATHTAVLAARDADLADHRLRSLVRIRSQAFWRRIIETDRMIDTGDLRYEIWVALRDELFTSFRMSLSGPPHLQPSMTPDELRSRDRELARSEARLAAILGVRP